tara:strand:+ start:556 stop:1647 length:1092 start_codon:yes stop_codon:yes gene_type:complete
MNIIEESNARLFIKLKSFKKNWHYLNSLSKNKNIGLSVKANCYGLGLKIMCKTLVNEGCQNFFVANSTEALQLRKILKNVNIYVLNGIKDIMIAKKLIQKNIFIVINNHQDLKIVKKCLSTKKEKISCAVHFDTGMNRLGFSEKDIFLISRSIEKYLDPKLVISHLSNSENKTSKFNKFQLSRFKKIKDILDKKFKLKYSLANSNGIFLGKSFHFDLIRTGGLAFGLHLKNKKNNIKNIISLKAKIIQIRLLEQGSPIGYGSKYITRKKSLIATLAIGYADGIPRNYKGYFFLKGKKVKICGNISMDLTCVDVTGINRIKVNDWVEIFGDNIPVEKFAFLSDTISYDILSSLGNRIERVYLNS